MAQSIDLDTTLEGVVPYEPALMRVPIPSDAPIPDDELFKATAKTAQDILKRSGAPTIEISDDDVANAQSMFTNHMHKAPLTKAQLVVQKPATILKLEALVSEYDWRVIQHADQIRFLVTNKLLDLSDNKDPRVQLKAVELLGKLADVGMFVDKQEVTYKQQSAEDLQKQLQEKLGLLIQGDISDVDPLPKRDDILKVQGVVPLADVPDIDAIDLANMMQETYPEDRFDRSN
jgi:hypothetical protein